MYQNVLLGAREISRLEKSRTKGTKLVSLRARLLSGSGFVSEGFLELFSKITNKIWIGHR